MRVLYFGTYRANYSRNQIMIEGLRSNGVEVIECHVPLWHGIEDRIQIASGGWIKPSFWWRVISTYFNLIGKFLRCRNFDVMVVGYPGQFDIFIAKLLSIIRHKPLAWDVFMSIYLIALERGLNKHKFTLFLIHTIESLAVKLPQILIIDTDEYRQWLCKHYQISENKVHLVPTGADDRIFTPPKIAFREQGKFRVIYFGSYIKNHGVEYIIEAANLLKDKEDIEFLMIGDGPELNNAIDLTDKYGLHNVQFIKWVDKAELVQYIAHSDVCLGAFGETPQSLMTIQNKIYESMAMAKSVITGESIAVKRLFIDKVNIYLCERKNAVSLAQAILELKNNQTLRYHLATNGYTLFIENYSLIKNGIRMKNILSKLYIPSK